MNYVKVRILFYLVHEMEGDFACNARARDRDHRQLQRIKNNRCSQRLKSRQQVMIAMIGEMDWMRVLLKVKQHFSISFNSCVRCMCWTYAHGRDDRCRATISFPSFFFNGVWHFFIQFRLRDDFSRLIAVWFNHKRLVKIACRTTAFHRCIQISIQ